MRRYISFILTVLILLFASQPCFAEEIIFAQTPPDKPLFHPQGTSFKTEAIATSPVQMPRKVWSSRSVSFEDYIVDAVVSSQSLPKTITGLSQFSIHLDDFSAAYFDLVLKNPQTLLRTAYTVYYDRTTGIVNAIEPYFVVGSKEEADNARTLMNTALKEYTDGAQSYSNDLEKLLYVHDKMVADCTYDVQVLSEDTVNLAEDTVYHALGVFRDKKAVCQGYSQALYMIGKELGIELDFCNSEEANHMWNYVKLDGKWYHMDMTSDDPLVSDENGNPSAREETTAWHRYFLVSDSSLTVNAHGNDYCRLDGERYACSDTKYERDYLFNLNTLFTFKKASDGNYHMYRRLTLPSGASTVIEIKRPSLYTGAVLSLFFVAEEKYTTAAGNTQTINNLYIFHDATHNTPSLNTVVQYKNRINITADYSLSKGEGLIIGIAQNTAALNLSDFSGYVWDFSTLLPYSTKVNFN